MRVHVGSDHAGFEFKAHLADHLRSAGHDVVDHGALTYDEDDDYPPFCLRTGEAVVAEPGSLGIVIGANRNTHDMRL
jgi:ribose 5-phosphate isomerase B